MGARRGAIGLMHDTIISLLFLGIFALAVFTYIEKHTDGTGYFAKAYTFDLSTTADLVAAANGDVVVRYDNLKPLGMAFKMQDGRIEAKADTITLASGTYGRTGVWQGDASITSPSYLVLRKVTDAMSIRESETLMRSCPVGVLPGPIYLDGPEPARAAFTRILSSTSISVAAKAADARAKITLIRGAPGKSSVDFASTSPQGKDFSCHFLQQLASVTPVAFESTSPPIAGDTFTVTATIHTATDATVTDDQLGRAAALAVLGYAR